MRTCKSCGKTFEPRRNQPLKQFCTSACAQSYHRPSVPIRIVVATSCPQCGKPIVLNAGGNKVYCSLSCRNKSRRIKGVHRRAKEFYEPRGLNPTPPQRRIWETP